MNRPTIIAVGELLVEFVSHRKGCDLHTLSEYSGPYPSGAPAICIDQAARIGAESHIFGGVGADNFGTALIDRLESNGVRTSDVQVLENKTTGVAFVSYFEDGSRTFIFHLNNTASDAIDPQKIAVPDGPLIMHISGSSLGNPTLRHAIETTADKVIDRGGQLSCDPNARPELMGDPEVKTVLTKLISKSSYLFPSDSDLEFLYPECSQEQAVAKLINAGASTVALTKGEEGSTIFTKDSDPININGYKVEEVDPTGAGDCYCGTFLAMITKGKSVETSGRYATAAGALAVTKRGPMEGNSSLETIEAFINEKRS